MSVETTNMGLTAWNSTGDFFDHGELANNWTLVDEHDHTTGKGAQIQAGGLANNAVTTSNIAAGAVGTTALANGSVTSAKFGTDVAGGTWHYVGAAGEPAFENSWVNYGSGYQNLRFKQTLGIVHIQGLVTAGDVPGAPTSGVSPVFTLPSGYRPGGVLNWVVFAAVANMRLDIAGNGQVFVTLPSVPSTYVSLTVSFAL